MSRLILAGVIVAPALFISGCSTTIETFQPDGKTLASRTKVGAAHEIQLPNGVKVTTSEGVIKASKEVAIRGLELGGAAIASEALKAASEAVKQVPEPPVEPSK